MYLQCFIRLIIRVDFIQQISKFRPLIVLWIVFFTVSFFALSIYFILSSTVPGVWVECVSIHFVKVKLYFSRLEFIYLLVRLKIFLSCLWYPFKMVLCAVRELPRGGRIKYTKFYEFSFFLLPKRLIRKAYLRDT